MYSINSVTIVGHLGADADIRTMQNNQQVATVPTTAIRIATPASRSSARMGTEW